MKKIKSFVKRIIDDYTKGFMELYGPCIECGVNPFN